MNYVESTPEQHKRMRCSSTEKSISDLEKEGWEQETSFHTKFAHQWNIACDKINSLQRNGDWETVLVQGQNEAEKKDCIAYIYKKKTPKRMQWEKDQGYL